MIKWVQQAKKGDGLMAVDNLLSFYTTAEKTAEGKTKILVLYDADDEKYFKDMVLKEFIPYCDKVALFYPSDCKRMKEDPEYQKELSLVPLAMDGIIVCVTDGILSFKNSIARNLLYTAIEAKKMILPYLCKEDLLFRWNDLFSIQLINPFNKDKTQIPNSVKISNWIDKIAPLSEDVVSKIWGSFSSKIFLSYRKVDRKNVFKLMHAIHNVKDVENPLAFSGIWYDENLTFEDGFENIIMKNIADSDLYLMLITNNTFALDADGNPNYVIRKEYPTFVAGDKPIIGIVLPGTDMELAKETFPAVASFISIENAKEIVGTLAPLLPDRLPFSERNADECFYMGLAYSNGIGVEKYTTNAYLMFDEAVKRGNHKEALTKLIDICFDEEDHKSRSGFFSIEKGLKFHSRLVDILIEETDGTDEKFAAVALECIQIARRLRVSGEMNSLDMAYNAIKSCITWLYEIIAQYPSEYLESILGEAKIEAGMIMYACHRYMAFKDPGIPGAIEYLNQGITGVLIRAKSGALCKEDVQLLSDAYNKLADSYYKLAKFSNQRSTLIQKLDVMDRYATNEMDRAQLLDHHDAYFAMAEASLMCGQRYLKDAVSDFKQAEDYLNKAVRIYYDSIITEKQIRLYNAWAMCTLCQMDIAPSREMANFYLKKAIELLNMALGLGDMFISGSEVGLDELNTIKYLHATTHLHKFQTTKNYAPDPQLLETALALINDINNKHFDHDFLHVKYRIHLEIIANDIPAIFADKTNVNVDLLNKRLEKLNECITELEADKSKHNDYWLALDRIELYAMKGRYLVKAMGAGLTNDNHIDVINTALVKALEYADTIYKKAGTETSKVLLGALVITCNTCAMFCNILGDEASKQAYLKKVQLYSQESLRSQLNDYMR